MTTIVYDYITGVLKNTLFTWAMNYMSLTFDKLILTSGMYTCFCMRVQGLSVCVRVR